MAALLGETQPGDAGASWCGDGAGDSGQGLGAGDRVVAELLDAEQASVGGEADLPQCGQLVSRFPIWKSRVLLIVVSARSAWSFRGFMDTGLCRDLTDVSVS